MGLGHVVIIEDEAPIRKGIVAALRVAGYEPIEAEDGEAGLVTARRQGVDLVLLDLMLPKMDGIDVLEQLRRTHPTLPVIILTARGSEDERVGGFHAGADDYMVKPFSARELVARVQAVLRRSPERPAVVKELFVGESVVDLERREVRLGDGGRQVLSETECAILSHLASNPNRAVSRDELLTRLWGLSGSGIETRTIDMHVARLRSKLAAASARCEKGFSHQQEHQGKDEHQDKDEHHDEQHIVTVRGKGYMLGPGVRRSTSSGGDASAGADR
ncbi:MAG: response regulator transcription factor [Phycisphaerae bacterium]|nr:response regulator transcription factor [Phycisphaerae bacterium]